MTDTRLQDFTEFKEFPKIHRWERDIVITEKIDGVNSQVVITHFDEDELGPTQAEIAPFEALVDSGDATRVDLMAGEKAAIRYLRATSRSGYIKPGKQSDNHGFAGWVYDNASQLVQLGVGKHAGEWWGYGIGRGYGMDRGERHFSLFNVSRFNDANIPPCCRVVPVLYRGPLKMQSGELATDFCLRRLQYAGSEAARGYRNFEGFVVYHTTGNVLFKRTTGPEEQGGKGAA